MMQPDKIVRLIERLTSKTESGELRWSEGARVNTYQISFSDYSIVIEMIAQRNSVINVNGYAMRILDERGDVVVNIMDDLTVGIMASEFDLVVVESKIMFRLFAAARASLTRARDRAVEELLKQLS